MMPLFTGLFHSPHCLLPLRLTGLGKGIWQIVFFDFIITDEQILQAYQTNINPFPDLSLSNGIDSE